ncbi:MAG: pimeloyl-ACP methyl ester carboxylesterase [Planctomycetota bacterium]|jgi:pimeloyl-ACP methyl ester carboxylesterase
MEDQVRIVLSRSWPTRIRSVLLLGLAVASISAPHVGQESSQSRLLELASANPLLELQARQHVASGTTVLVGSYRVWEDRVAKQGRRIDLNLILLPALSKSPAPDPVFVLHGGPGAAATAYLGGLAQSWLREHRDIVLVDQRGTGRSNPLRIETPGGAPNPQTYLDPLFVPEVFEAQLPRLRELADLAKYTTPIAMDDLNEVRGALGYGEINLRGGSYGSRAALVYLRRHPETARTATLNGIAPIAFRNPLYHAAAAQGALEVLAKECAGDPRYRKAFPDLLGMVEQVLDRLDEQPALVKVMDPKTREEVEVTLTRTGFAEALRVMMYATSTNRRVPLLVKQAFEGNYTPFAQSGLERGRALRGMLSLGMLMCVTGSEDLPRIDPGEIADLTEGTFLGDQRVRQQLAVGEIWPRGEVPEDYGEHVTANVPVLLWSGTHDPITPPRWGAQAADHLPNALHLVVPGAHGVGGPQVARIEREFLEKGSIEGLDTSALSEMRMPPLAMPDRDL